MASTAMGHAALARATMVTPGRARARRVARATRAATRPRAGGGASAEAETETETASADEASFDLTSCLPPAEDALPAAVETFLKRRGRHAVFSARQTGSVAIEEVPGGRSLRDYMSLPASQYSTLDGEKVERVGDDTFVCTLGKLDFLGFVLQPVLTAQVDVKPDGAGCVIRVVAAEIHGSGLVETVNDMFEIDSVNRVGWTDRCDVGPTGEGRCEIASETKVTVYLLVPSWFPFTVKATERTGNFVVGQVVKQVVPRFLAQLKSDYATWAAGDDSREAKGADLFDVDIGSPADVEA